MRAFGQIVIKQPEEPRFVVDQHGNILWHADLSPLKQCPFYRLPPLPDSSLYVTELPAKYRFRKNWKP